MRTLHRVLKPGGVLLATVPGVSQISHEQCADYWCWSFTRLSVLKLLEETFANATYEVEVHGNVLASLALLHGLSAEELSRAELDHRDPDYETLITVRAVKA